MNNDVPILDAIIKDAYLTSIAISADGLEPLDYKTLRDYIYKKSACLRAFGVSNQDRVAVIIDSRPDMATTCLSVMSTAICIPLNPAYALEEFKDYLLKIKASILITDLDQKHAAYQAALMLSIPIVVVAPAEQKVAGINQWVFPETSKKKCIDSSAAISPDSLALLLFTSGTTSEIKLVPLSHKNILFSASALARSLLLNTGDICLNMLPFYHVGALVDLLVAPLLCGGRVHISDDMNSSTFFHCLNKHVPTWYQGVPTMIQDLLDYIKLNDIDISENRLRFIRSVSSPLPAIIHKQCEQYFDTPVIEIYGMTETAGMITSNPLPPALRKIGSVGISHGTEIEIVDDSGNPVGATHRGEVVVKGDNLTQGYESDDDNEAIFFGEWFRTGDEGYLDEDGYLFLTGRIKEMINRGGEKISPLEIDRILLMHPSIMQAASFSIPHKSLGEEIVAAVVLHESHSLTLTELQEYLHKKLASFKIPKKIFCVNQLPITRGGKLKRHLLTEEYFEKDLDLTVLKTKNHAETLSQLAATITQIWQKLLNISEVSIDDNFFELGGDSLKAVTFVNKFEKETGHKIEVVELMEAQTIRELVDHIQSKESVSEVLANTSNPVTGIPDKSYHQLKAIMSSWQGQRLTNDSLIVGRNTLGKKIPIFWCVNSNPEFTQLVKYIDLDQPVYGMRSLYKVKKRTYEQNMALANYYVHEILRIWPDGPYIIGGYCIGGAISFEIAQQLIKMGKKIKILLLQEAFIPRPYEGRVALFISGPSRHSPYYKFHQPEMGWLKYYTGHVTLSKFNCEHIQFYDDENVKLFVKQLKLEIDNKLMNERLERHIANQDLQILDDDDYQVVIKAPLFLSIEAGEQSNVNVTVKNKSSTTWHSTEKSGITLGNQWYDFRKKNEILNDGNTALVSNISPGEEFEISLLINAPETPGIWFTEVDLVEQGVCWFKERSKSSTRIIVIVKRKRS